MHGQLYAFGAFLDCCEDHLAHLGPLDLSLVQVLLVLCAAICAFCVPHGADRARVIDVVVDMPPVALDQAHGARLQAHAARQQEGNGHLTRPKA